jgi:hypothetical protein
MLRRLLLAPLLALAACATPTTPRDSMDAIATDYVKMTLALGEREEGYVDAYYGPPEWQAAAKRDTRTAAQLGAEARRLSARLAALPPATGLEARRRAFMQGQLTAAETRVRMMGGAKLPFAEEAQGLFAVRPDIKPLTAYDPVLARIDRLVPGPGPLSDRVDAFQNRFTIPKDRLDPVFRAAIAECRRRTVARIPLPAEEKFTLEFVTGKSWSGYNYYKGNYTSLIQVNTDLPIRISRAVDLGCHEGYPGHHAYNVLLERELAKKRGWIEFTVNPLYSPQSIISEGSANYGIELAFPGPEKLAFETRVLYPLAGLPTADAARYDALLTALQDLGGARFTIARDYLEGRLTKDQAVAMTQRYQLVSAARAAQSVSFTDQYRSYVINYGLGLDMVRAHVERGAADPAVRWTRMEQLLSEPTLPGDLAR